MLNNNVYYHGIIRKTVIAFGRLFSNIYIDRKQDDSVEGDTVQRLQIPIAYAPKEKWLVRLEQDPSLEQHTYISLPRMSFEILSYNYDAVRKVNKMNKIVCRQEGAATTIFTPVPYNVNIALYVLTKTQEDGLQIIEQILPYFTPDYTLSINAIPDMNIIQDVPINLDDISVSDEYDGDFQTRRFVTHTLNFTLKVNLFGPESSNGMILQSEANLGTTNPIKPEIEYVANGDPNTGDITEQWNFDL